MGKVITIIGIDISKRYFQLHGATASGEPVLCRQLTRPKLLGFLAKQPVCRVVMEVCGSAHHWGRMIREIGHEVRLIPPMYVKPYVKRQKNDANDAGAIVEAAQRPTMRFVAVKTEEEQARSVVFRARALLVHQRTQTINALRGHLAEFGLVAPLGTHNVGRLEEVFAECEECFPALVPPAIRRLIERTHDLDAEIDELDREIRRIVREDEALGRLMTIPARGGRGDHHLHHHSKQSEAVAQPERHDHRRAAGSADHRQLLRHATDGGCARRAECADQVNVGCPQRNRRHDLRDRGRCPAGLYLGYA